MPRCAALARINTPQHRHFTHLTIASISKSASSGRRATSTAERAGVWFPKNAEYTAFTALKSSMFFKNTCVPRPRPVSTHSVRGSDRNVCTYGGLHDLSDLAPARLDDRLHVLERLLRLLLDTALNLCPVSAWRMQGGACVALGTNARRSARRRVANGGLLGALASGWQMWREVANAQNTVFPRSHSVFWAYDVLPA